MESAPEGGRNSALNDAAFNMGSLVLAGAIDARTVEDCLTAAARSAGLGDVEIVATIRSGLSGAERKVGARVLPDSAESKPSSAFDGHLLTPTSLRSLPEPTPLIENVLDQGTTALLYGKWGSSKSFIALDWASSVASGRPWQGRRTEQARVLYVVAEGAAGFAGRLDAWETGWQMRLDDRWMSFLPRPVNLVSGVDALVSLVRNEGYGFIVLDTLARCMVGGDENSAKDAGVVVDAMTQLMYATPGRRGVVLGVHHTGKDGRTLRGSSAFEAGADTVYFTERDGQTVTLRRTKRKDGPESDIHALRLSPVVGTESCVVEAGRRENFHENPAESTALLRNLMSDMFATTGVSNSELRALALEHGMSQATFYRARADLLKDGWIINTGSGSRAFFELAIHSQGGDDQQSIIDDQ